MKKLLIAGLVVLVLGIGISVASFAALGFDINKISTRKITTEEVDISEKFTNIEIDVAEEDISFIKCEEGESKVIFTHNAALKATIEVKGDTLVIKEKGVTSWTDFIGEDGDPRKLEIYLPAGEYGELDIDIASADVAIDEDFDFDVYDIDSASGDIRITGGEPASIDINTASGSVNILDVKVDKIDIDSASGDITLENVIAISIDIDTASGDVDLLMSDASSINIDTASGDVTGTLLSGKVFDVDTASGDIDVPSDGQGGKCDVDTASGDVTFTIAGE